MKIKLELELDTENKSDYNIIKQLVELLEELKENYENQDD